MKILLTIAGITAVITMLIGGGSKNSFTHATADDNSLIIIKSGSGTGNIFLASGETLLDANRISLKKEEGTKITLRAEAEPGCKFGGWAGACKGQTNSCTIIVGSQSQIIATFNLIRE